MLFIKRQETGLLGISALTILTIEQRCDLRALFHAALP
jgi:hypothetical protein